MATFPIFYTICMTNDRIIIGNVVEGEKLPHNNRKFSQTMNLLVEGRRVVGLDLLHRHALGGLAPQYYPQYY